MAKPRLVIESNHDGYYIAWYLPDESDLGGELGDDTYTVAQLAKAKPDDRDHIAATIAASTTKGVERYNGRYVWESKSDARDALRAANVAIKAAASSVPWPEWAVTAAAARWKAPKGWTP